MEQHLISEVSSLEFQQIVSCSVIIRSVLDFIPEFQGLSRAQINQALQKALKGEVGNSYSFIFLS